MDSYGYSLILIFGVSPMSGPQKARLIGYQYDALDRLTSHGRLDSVERQRFYRESRLVTEIQGDEHISIVQHGDRLLAQRQRNSGGLLNTLLATDLQNSVLNTLVASRPAHFVYSPYGHRLCDSGLSSLLGFNGQRPDPVTGHYLLGNGYRAFNPVLMRFNSPDSVSPFGKGGLNAYAYCQGDPINRSDPTGHVFSALSTLFTKIKARYLSFVTGDHVKPVKQYTRISEGLSVFVDEYKGGSRVNILGHGVSSGGVLREAGELLGPNSLSIFVKNAGFNFESFESARLLTCHSGSTFNHSLNPLNAEFGKLFADFSGLPVKAYKGQLLVGARQSSSISRLNIGETSNRTEYFSIPKRPQSRHSTFFNVQYAPVKFLPEHILRNVRTE